MSERFEGRFDDQMEVRGQLPTLYLIAKQIDRCNISATNPDPEMFNNNVEALKHMLPPEKVNELEERVEEYTVQTKTYHFKTWCGHNLGTIENPLLDDDGNVISPIAVDEDVVDYKELYKMVWQELNNLGICWKIERITAEVGRIKEDTRQRKPTPIFAEDDEFSPVDLEDSPSQ